jgi:hypothetical protein
MTVYWYVALCRRYEFTIVSVVFTASNIRATERSKDLWNVGKPTSLQGATTYKTATSERLHARSKRG